MIENMRGRTAETKYGRIPLWLYETGIPLQAIATYGWLHGKYGHYERVMPSYGTLAKELGVSRGSVIAYVKALMGAGALRIEESGAVDHRTNTYVIAFNEPFQVEPQVDAGQHSDQKPRLVSPLTRSGQPADQAGQPVEHEEDVLNQTKNTSPSRPRLPKPRAVPDPAPATTEAEEEPFTQNQLDQAAAFLQQLPGRWAVGRRTARDLAPLLLEAVEAQAWNLDAELAAKLSEDLGPVRTYAGALKHRIEDLPRRPRPATVGSGARPVAEELDLCDRCRHSQPRPGWIEVWNPTKNRDVVARCDHQPLAA